MKRRSDAEESGEAMTEEEIIRAVHALAASMRNCYTDYSTSQSQQDTTALILKAELTFRRIIDTCLLRDAKAGE